MSAKPKKAGMRPAVAIAIFCGCTAVAATSILRSIGGGMSSVGDDEVADIDPADEAASAESSVAVSRDLLAPHGSYDPRGDVRMAFAVWAEGAFAAPAGETAAVTWAGEDPPRLRVGVVMVSAGSARAVFGGQLVGIGDTVAGGRIGGIEPGVVRLDWRGRKLHYDLGGDAPREFQAELARRSAAAPADGAETQSGKANKKEQG
jgi:hypothetical protein